MTLLDWIALSELEAVALLLWRRAWRTDPTFLYVQLVMLGEWPLEIIARSWPHYAGFYLWHWCYQANILLALIAAYSALTDPDSKLHLPSWWMVSQALVKIAHYALHDRVEEFNPAHSLRVLSKFLDLFINISVIVACRKEFHARSEPSSHPPAHAQSAEPSTV